MSESSPKMIEIILENGIETLPVARFHRKRETSTQIIIMNVTANRFFEAIRPYNFVRYVNFLPPEGLSFKTIYKSSIKSAIPVVC